MGIMMVKIYAPNFYTLNLDETVVAFLCIPLPSPPI